MKITPSGPFYRFCTWLDSVASKSLLAGLMVAYVVFAVAVIVAISGTSGNEVIPLDLRFWYEPTVVYATFEALGEAGRYRYLVGALTLDILYPLIYSSMFAVWITVLLPGKTRISCTLRLLPFAILAADLLENSLIAILLTIYPQRLDVLAWAATACTACKWSLAAAVIAITLVLTLRAAWRALRIRLNLY